LKNDKNEENQMSMEWTCDASAKESKKKHWSVLRFLISVDVLMRLLVMWML